MKILCIADEESKYYWDYFKKEKLDDIDLIISSGDLKSEYLSFLVTMGHAPVLYVHGNHDGRYSHKPPEGCDCIEDKVINFRGLRIAGFGGCLSYNAGPHQYTNQEMARRIRKLKRPLKKGVDIVVTHAPVKGYGDMPDHTHEGFTALLDLVNTYHPRYLLHGHVHQQYTRNTKREMSCGDTTLINVCESYILEIPDPPASAMKETWIHRLIHYIKVHMQ